MRTKTALVVGVLVVSGSSHFIAAAPILEYKFDAIAPAITGDVASTGDNTSAVTMRDGSATIADRLSADGLGVSGLPGDRAFVNNQANNMGSAASSNNLGNASLADGSGSPSVDGLSSLTIAAWYKADSAVGNFARLVWKQTGSTGFEFTAKTGSNSRALSFGVNGSIFGGFGVDSSTSYTDVGTWTFVAVTYDGTSSSNNVKFYRGTIDDPVALVSTHTLNNGPIVDSTTPLVIGNNGATTGSRPFDALIDNVRLFGSSSDGAGVLSLTDLEGLRSSDVPEPIGLAGVGLLGLILSRRRRVRG